MAPEEKELPELAWPRSSDAPRRQRKHGHFVLAVAVLLLVAHVCFRVTSPSQTGRTRPPFEKVQQCAIDNFHADLSFLDSAAPISADEFVTRRDRLAQALVASNVDAFVLEPGYTFQYYGNTSQVDWEPWEPEERPFLMVILPVTSPTTGLTVAQTAFLAPHFEAGRVRTLGIPSRDDEDLDIVVWEEHWNPYETLLQSRLFKNRAGVLPPTLMIEEEMRDFIARGLVHAGFFTVGPSKEAELVRQIKSPAEVELLRAVNTGTVAAVRAMRPCLVEGLTEDEVRDILDGVIQSVAGFKVFFDIVLFEEHGALPHGGSVTGRKKLERESMVVIDVGAHYLGYSSDICRSFFMDPPPASQIGQGWWWWIWRHFATQMLGLLMKEGSVPAHETRAADPSLHAEKLKVWDIVLDAQAAAAAAFKPGNSAASVDIAARSVIEDAGYGAGFTHRVGHGIGIKAHESPYLNKFNTEILLQPGMTFTNEPGIYLLNRFGVRHEDIFLVKENGEAELLTGQLARGPYEP